MSADRVESMLSALWADECSDQRHHFGKRWSDGWRRCRCGAMHRDDLALLEMQEADQ